MIFGVFYFTLSSPLSYLEHLDGDLSRRLAGGRGGHRDRGGAVGAEEQLLLRLLLLLLKGLLTHQVLSHQNPARTKRVCRSGAHCRIMPVLQT